MAKKFEKWGYIGAFAVLFTALACLFPLSGDDWQWGSEQGFATFNGRYGGNLLVQLLTQVWFRPLVVGLTVSVIVLILSSFWGGGRRTVPVILLIMLLPRVVFTQVFQWTAGFSNFTFPVMLLLVELVIILRFDRIDRRLKIPAAAALLLLCFVTQLFAEHITLSTAALALLWCAYGRIARKKWDFAALVALAGFIAGAFVMLSNPSYRSINPSAHAMPSFAEMFTNALSNYMHVLAPELVTANFAITASTCVLLVLLIRTSGKRRRATAAFTAFFCFFAGLCLVRVLDPAIAHGRLWTIAEGLLTAVYALFVLLSLIIYLPRGGAKTALLFGAAAIALLSGTLLPVTPIGPRCLFVADAVLILMLGLLAKYLADIRARRPSKAARFAALCVLLAVFCAKLYIYGSIAAQVRERQAYVSAQMQSGAAEITVPDVGYGDYAWQLNMNTPYIEYIYKRFYGIPDTYTITH
ncbi:MAG: DUF6056 family protein [Oscillospiraceae bacterium]|nr:DUF6056 family protein [Oscillospiraceae bacterium]